MKTIAMCALAVLAVGCQNEVERTDAVSSAPVTPPPMREEAARTPAAPPPAVEATPPAERAEAQPAAVAVPGVGKCSPDAELGAAASRFMSLADADGDGRVSRDEAGAAASFLVGGVFFRADADSDGIVTPEEGRAVRAQMATEHPMAAMLLARARDATGTTPLVKVAKLLDVEYGEPVRAADARSAMRDGVDELFGAVDADRDANITMAEARAASLRGVAMAGETAFREVDRDGNGTIDMPELEQMLDRAARSAFDMADGDRDGRLTHQEAAEAVTGLARRVTGAEVMANN